MNILESFIYQSRHSKNGITFIGVDNDIYISYPDFFIHAKRVLSLLRNKGVSRGHKLILQLTSPYEFLTTFWAGIMGGFVLVPLPINNTKEAGQRARNIQDTFGDSYIITNKILGKFAGPIFDTGEKCKKIELDFLEISGAKDDPAVEFADISDDGIALVQFSSGSTSFPKGIINTHKNIEANCLSMASSGRITSSDVFMSWLPLTHTMGLITMHILPLTKGASQNFIPTEIFLKTPLKWLEKMSQYNVSATASPNFGFKLCLRHMGLGGLSGDTDLSHVRIILNGAEPVSAEICQKFTSSLEKYKLSPKCIAPAYGITEACSGVSMGLLEDDIKVLSLKRNSVGIGSRVELCGAGTGYDVVSLGPPLEFNQVRIVDQNGLVLPQGYIGAIQIKGENVTKGYYNNPKATYQAFAEDGWLSTGDIGFFWDKSIYIAGRSKEMILVNGLNYYLYDIERVVLANQKSVFEECAAVGAYNYALKCEDLVIFVKCMNNVASSNNFIDIARNVVSSIQKSIGISITAVVNMEELPHNANGKLQRFMLKEGYEENAIPYLDIYSCNKKENYKNELPGDMADIKLKDFMINQISDILGLPQNTIDIDTPFSDLGIDSMNMIILINRIEKFLHISLDISLLWSYPSIRQLSEYLSEQAAVVNKIEQM